MPARILFYYPYNQTMSGGARTLLNLLEGIEKRGIRPVVASQSENPLVEEVRRRGGEVHVIPFPSVLDVYNKGTLSYSLGQKLRAGAAMVAYNRRVASLIEQCRAQAVWTRGTKGVLMTAAAARWSGVPVVWSIGLEQRSGMFMRLLQGLALCTATDVVTQARRQPEEIFGPAVARLFAKKFRTIYPGIEDERRTRIRTAVEAIDRSARDRFDVLCAASLYPRKNQLMLLRAVRGLVKKHPNVRVRLAGAMPDENYVARLRTFVQREGLEEYVEFLGWRDDVPELLAQSDALVVCSHGEGVPHVIREAMHARLPVVGTRVGGVPETIEHGETGFLVEVDDMTDLQARLAWLLEHPDEGCTMGRNARRRAETIFSQEAWKRAYGNLLRERAATPALY